ncbi:terpene synthase [Micromonospora sp. ALFpr18c]|uniref:terpene synthase family protein n=1 Tax=unclassified Micromonospora TaxID=2617518 RepID=UPI00124AEBFE|nr:MULTISPECIES: terpene synthase [unclassified Micromonospora]KAB1944126.1 terpene synthase [Micromonospora sp. ALFpr18c]MDG4760841.1 terpene synthase [Micromonospora sp. WMMD710]
MTTGEVLWTLRAECPVPARLSPYADQVQEWLLDLLPGLGLALDDAALHRLARGAFARYAGRLYPDATEADLRTLTALFTWFFLVDDACDGPGRLAPEQIRALRNGTLALLHDGPRLRQAGLSGPLRRLLVLAWREPRRRMPARWRLRFADAVARHLDGTWQEAVNKEVGRRPGVTEYVELRRATSAAEVSYPLVEFVTGRPLPDPVYHHPLLREIARTGNDLLSWYNDLASLDRDRVTAGGHNLVLAMQGEWGVPTAAAVDRAAERWRESMHHFVALRDAVPSFGPALDEAVTDHLDGVAYAVRGTIDWTLESARYPTSAGQPVSGA